FHRRRMTPSTPGASMPFLDINALRQMTDFRKKARKELSKIGLVMTDSSDTDSSPDSDSSSEESSCGKWGDDFQYGESTILAWHKERYFKNESAQLHPKPTFDLPQEKGSTGYNEEVKIRMR
ncbi:hypothetical protein DPMN_050977, partial [Dreissena polymorpha]